MKKLKAANLDPLSSEVAAIGVSYRASMAQQSEREYAKEVYDAINTLLNLRADHLAHIALNEEVEQLKASLGHEVKRFRAILRNALVGAKNQKKVIEAKKRINDEADRRDLPLAVLIAALVLTGALEGEAIQGVRESNVRRIADSWTKAKTTDEEREALDSWLAAAKRELARSKPTDAKRRSKVRDFRTG